MSQDNSSGRPVDLKIGADGVTLREIVHTSSGGDVFRVELTNQLGALPLKIGAANVGLPSAAGSNGVAPGSAHALTFGGNASVTIPPGAVAISDPVPMQLAPESNLSISLFIPSQTLPQLTIHQQALETNYIAAGDQTAAPTLTNASTLKEWYLLKAVDVQTRAPNAATVVALGDSITDGSFSTTDANLRWPDELGRRLQASPRTRHLGVVDVGIGGNRVLHDVNGPSALARFDRDVLAQDGVKYLIILESVNDLGHATDPVKPYDIVSADDLIWGLTQLAERAHAHGIKVFIATLTPYAKSKYDSPAAAKISHAINSWIRTTNLIDGVVDLEKATQDPANPAQFLPAFDHGDHLHPNDAGYKAMGDAIDLNLFE
jgi:lysophospholipase L1-like esterase